MKMKKTNTKKTLCSKLFPLLAGCITALALCMTGNVASEKTFFRLLAAEISGLGLPQLILATGVLLLYYRTWESFLRTSKWITHLLGAVFAGCMIVGMSFSRMGSWAFLFAGKKQMVIALLAFGGFWILFDVLLSLFYAFVEKQSFCGKENKRLPAFVEKHFRLTAFLVILALWAVYLIPWFPGTVPFDGWRQIWMYNGWNTITNQHPWQSTYLIGGLMDLGCRINDNMGIFFVTGAFSLLEAFCYAAVCGLLRSWKTPRWFYGGAVLFFGILPPFGVYAQAIMKDAPFGALLAWYFTLYLDVCFLKKEALLQKKPEGSWRDFSFLPFSCAVSGETGFIWFWCLWYFCFSLWKRKRGNIRLLCFWGFLSAIREPENFRKTC